MQDQIRVLRIIEYTGDRDAVEFVIKASLHGDRLVDDKLRGKCTIRAATLGTFPEILESKEKS